MTTYRFNIDNWSMPEIEHAKPTKWGWTVYYPKEFILGKFIDIGWGTFINAEHGVIIKKRTQIGPFCAILSSNSINNKIGQIIIGKNVRIGAYTLILPGPIIPDNAFVRARSLVYPGFKFTFYRNNTGIQEIL